NTVQNTNTTTFPSVFNQQPQQQPQQPQQPLQSPFLQQVQQQPQSQQPFFGTPSPNNTGSVFGTPSASVFPSTAPNTTMNANPAPQGFFASAKPLIPNNNNTNIPMSNTPPPQAGFPAQQPSLGQPNVSPSPAAS